MSWRYAKGRLAYFFLLLPACFGPSLYCWPNLRHLPPSLKSLVMCLLGRDRGILSIHAYNSCSSSSLNSRSIVHNATSVSEQFVKIQTVGRASLLASPDHRLFKALLGNRALLMATHSMSLCKKKKEITTFIDVWVLF